MTVPTPLAVGDELLRRKADGTERVVARYLAVTNPDGTVTNRWLWCGICRGLWPCTTTRSTSRRRRGWRRRAAECLSPAATHRTDRSGSARRSVRRTMPRRRMRCGFSSVGRCSGEDAERIEASPHRAGQPVRQLRRGGPAEPRRPVLDHAARSQPGVRGRGRGDPVGFRGGSPVPPRRAYELA